METVTRELTCIGCPMGCPLTVTMEAGEVISVTGNTCKRGDIYARKEVTNPTRIVTSTVRVTGGDADMVSVKTKEDIPKGKIFECVKALKTVEVPAPVHIGDVLVGRCCRYRCGYRCNKECRNCMMKVNKNVWKAFIERNSRPFFSLNIQISSKQQN